MTSDHTPPTFRLYPLDVEDWPDDKQFMLLERLGQAMNLAYGHDELYSILEDALEAFKDEFPEVWSRALETITP